MMLLSDVVQNPLARAVEEKVLMDLFPIFCLPLTVKMRCVMARHCLVVSVSRLPASPTMYRDHTMTGNSEWNQ
jgi:hypothetical protein